MTVTDFKGGASHTEFRTSFEISKRWNPIIRSIIGPYLLRDSTEFEDCNESTDSIVLKSDGIRVACRVREPGYVERYGWEITFTCRRETGSKCEWDKMILGDWSDWFFYGHGTQTRSGIYPWFLLDLKLARPYLRSGRWYDAKPNKDAPGRGCFFYSFDLREHPALRAALIDERPPPA